MTIEPPDVPPAFKEWLADEMKRTYKEYIESLPWWCGFCGVGGNYVGRRPDDWMWPTSDQHTCDIPDHKYDVDHIQDIKPNIILYDEIYWPILDQTEAKLEFKHNMVKILIDKDTIIEELPEESRFRKTLSRFLSLKKDDD